MSENNSAVKKNLWQMLKFTLFSISAGVIQIGTYTLFYELFHWTHWVAYLVSLVLSVVWNFTFNRKYTFRSDANVPKAMMLVAIFYLVFTPVSTWAGKALTDNGVNNYLVEIGTMVVNFITEFLYQRFVVFRGTIDNTVKH